jgi:hypothetical protein
MVIDHKNFAIISYVLTAVKLSFKAALPGYVFRLQTLYV